MNGCHNPNEFRTVLVTGGAGYVGSALVPRLLQDGYHVKVADTFWYGRRALAGCATHPGLELLKLDIRDSAALSSALRGVDALIHLACISNDPSFELDPELGRSINYDAFAGLIRGAAAQGVRRFIYASSSSIYGVKDTPDVREDAAPRPLTDYAKYKLACERDLMAAPLPGVERVIIRPATVCGYAPRLRLDLSVNILTIHALVNRRIRIFGGKQLRPNLNINDMVSVYRMMLTAPGEKVDGEAFNAGYQNRTIDEIAHVVRESVGDPGVELEYVPTSDVRSYHINSDKIRKVLGFVPRYTIEDAVRSIAQAYRGGRIPKPMTDPQYRNIETMKALRVGAECPHG